MAIDLTALTLQGEKRMNLYGLRQLIGSIRTVRKNTIQIADDIPEEQYGYRPTPGSRSVAAVLVHIVLLSASGPPAAWR
jgi:uncharacterized damage-inducible protein DinB